jgi:hypothetical protein
MTTARALSALALVVGLAVAACSGGGGGGNPAGTPAGSTAASSSVGAGESAGASMGGSESPGASASGGAGSPGTGATTLCTDLQALRSNVQQLLTSSPATTSRQQLRQRLAATIASWSQVKQELATVAAADRQKLETAGEDLRMAIRSLPRNVPPREALMTVKPQATAFATAIRQTVQDVQCP